MRPRRRRHRRRPNANRADSIRTADPIPIPTPKPVPVVWALSESAEAEGKDEAKAEVEVDTDGESDGKFSIGLEVTLDVTLKVETIVSNLLIAEPEIPIFAARKTRFFDLERQHSFDVMFPPQHQLPSIQHCTMPLVPLDEPPSCSRKRLLSNYKCCVYTTDRRIGAYILQAKWTVPRWIRTASPYEVAMVQIAALISTFTSIPAKSI